MSHSHKLLAILLLLLPLTANEKRVFHLARGVAWTYVGQVRWTEPNSNRVRKSRVRWKSAVVRVFTSGDKTVAVIRGFPFDLDWYESGMKPQYTVLVEDHDTISYQRADGESQA